MKNLKQILNTPKTQNEYEKLLDTYNILNLEKMKKIIDIFAEQAEITPTFESDGVLSIPHSKFTESGLLLSDVLDILHLFEDINFMILSKFPVSKKDSISLVLPLHGLFAKNFHNFKKSLEVVIKNKYRLKNAIQTRLKYIEEEGKCFLEENNKKMLIGKTNSRKCRLLNCLFDQFGVARTLDVVFGNIQLPKDRKHSGLWNDYLGRRQRETIIRTTGKEIQRIISKNKLKKGLEFHVKDNMVWLESN